MARTNQDLEEGFYWVKFPGGTLLVAHLSFLVDDWGNEGIEITGYWSWPGACNECLDGRQRFEVVSDRLEPPTV